MSHRFEGHNLEDALNNAATTLGVERYQLTHKILVEKRGFLGGIKRIVIEADVNANATPPAAADAPFDVDPSDPPAYTGPPRTALGPQREPRESRGRGGAGGRGRDGNRHDDRRGGGGDGRGRRQQHSRREETLEPGDFERFAVEAPEQGPESEAATAVRGWCEQVRSLAERSGTIR